MEWKAAIDELKQLSAGAEFAVISSFSCNKDFLDGTLNFDHKFGNRLLLLLDDAEEFIFPSKSNYKVISKHEIPVLDSTRNLHSKIFLFGRKDVDGSFLLNCLIGSCNATVNGFLRNIEFWGSANGKFAVPNCSCATLPELFMNDKFDPSLASLEEKCVESNGDSVLGPAIDLLWRLVREYRGLDSGLEYGRSSCLSDRIMEKGSNEQNAIFVHSLGNNSLFNAVERMITTSLSEAQNEAALYLISPYHDWSCLNDIVTLCQKAIGHKDIKVQIRLLTDFPPDFQSRYLSEETFADLEKLKTQDSRICFQWKFWTSSSKIEVQELLSDEKWQDISSIFLHGKVLIASNDRQKFEAIVGSPNLTSAAISSTPKINIESAIWERNITNARAILNETTKLWDAAKEPTPAMIEKLNEWRKIREEFVLDSKIWIDAQQVIREYFQVNLRKQGQTAASKDVSIDELASTMLSIKILNGAPKTDLSCIKCIWLPNLDSSLRSEAIAKIIPGGEPEFSLKDQTTICRLFYKITVPTRLLRETTSQFKTGNEGEILLQKPSFAQQSYAYTVLAKTAKGWTEFSDAKESDSHLLFSPSTSIIGRAVTLRLYEKNIQRDLSVGWNSVTVTKSRPTIVIGDSCICSSSVCLELREQGSKDGAAVFPETVEISLNEATEIQPEIHIANTLSSRPYVARHFFKFPQKNPLVQSNTDNANIIFPLMLRYLDENWQLRPKASLYLKLKCSSYLKDAKDCNLSKIISQVLQIIPCLVIENFPSGTNVVDKASIIFNLETGKDAYDFLSKILESIILKWEILLWGRSIEGSTIEQIITYPLTRMVIEPEKIAEALQVSIDNLSFEGLIRGNFFLKLTSGWRIPIKTVKFSVSKAQDFLHRILSPQNPWITVRSYIRQPKALFDNIIELFFIEVTKEYPSAARSISEFSSKLRFGFFMEPFTYGQRQLDCQGFRLPKANAKSLIEKAGEAIVESITEPYFSEINNPSLPRQSFVQHSRAAITSDLEKTTLQVNEGTVIFPNLVLRKIGMDPLHEGF